MTHPRVIDGVRNPDVNFTFGPLVEGYVIRNSRVDGGLVSVSVDSKRRLTVRNVRIEDCRVGPSQICGAILDEVSIENLSNGDVLFVRGAALRHVVLRGRFDRVVFVSAVSPGIISERRQRAFEAANRRFYDAVDWALDIREAAFREIGIDGVPAHLLRLDPESQAVVSREEAARGAWRAVDLDGTWWHITLEELAVSRDSHTVLVVPKLSPAADLFYAALARLRAAGIATDPPPRPASQPTPPSGLQGWLTRSLRRGG